jgi:hypothetical protein
LALALVAAPQLAYVHTLSHLASASQADQEQQQAPEKTCDTCVALAHLGQALATQAMWIGLDGSGAAPTGGTSAQHAQRPPAHFQARGPPFFL